VWALISINFFSTRVRPLAPEDVQTPAAVVSCIPVIDRDASVVVVWRHYILRAIDFRTGDFQDAY
jgi:hypothetical protein